MADQDPDVEIRIKTTAEGDGAKRAQTELRGVESSAKEANRALKEAQHAAKAFGADAEIAASAAKGLFKQAGAAEGLIARLGSQIGVIFSGAVFGTALTIAGKLFQKVYTEIRAILELLDLISPRKIEDVNAVLAETKTLAEQAAEAVKNVAEAFDKAAGKAEELRKKQDELTEAKLADELARVDALEALGPGRGGFTPVKARLERTSLRLEASREKNAREKASIDEQENVIKAMQGFSSRQFSGADVAEHQKTIERERLLDRASKVLQIPKEKLRDPAVFDLEYTKALNLTQRYEERSGDLGEPFVPIPRDQADTRRASELQSLSRLSLLLRSPTRRIDRAREQLGAVNALAGEALPELERRRQITNLRGETSANTAAGDVFGLTGDLDKNTQLLQQLNEVLGTRFQAQGDVLRALLAKLKLTDDELQLLKQQTRNNVNRPG